MTALTAPLPLRKTTVWGAFAAAQVIPHRYGETSGALIQYDSTGLTWCWADHTVAAIDTVLVNGQPAGEWTLRNTVDSSGHAVALVVFGQPQDASAELIARGRGKLHPRTGALIESPAAAVWDILANIAGNDVSEAQLADFAGQCALLGLVVSGSIESADSTQSIIRALCTSVGAIFSADAAGLCKVWPGGVLDASRATLDIAVGLTAKAQLSDICNDLTIEFAYESGQSKQSMRLTAPDSIARYGTMVETLEAPWIASPRVAYDVASRVLAQRARPQWQVSATGIKRALRVGDTVTLQHPSLPGVSGDFMTLGRDYDMDQELTSITTTVPIGAVPALSLREQSSAFVPNPVTVSSQTIGTNRVLTLRAQEDGTPLVGATVTVDGTTPRTSDAAGNVVFPIAILGPGSHRLDIVTLDGRLISLTVVVDSTGAFAQTILLPPPATPGTTPYYP